MSLYVSIRKSFGDFVLQSSFESENGILGFLGASGCGKSMTLKCIAGIEKPDAGKIILNGKTLFDQEKGICLPPGKRKVGYLFQNYALFPNMTVEQNIVCGLNLEPVHGKRREKAWEMMERLEIAALAGHYPRQLSGGQQQRVALGRILVGNPELLLLDEPFSALDSYLRLQVEEELTRLLRSFGKDTILVSHNRDEIYRMCKTVAIMEQGRVKTCGMVKEVFAQPKSVTGAVLTGCKNIVKAQKRGAHLVFVPEWNMELSTEEPVEEGLQYIGIRAHSFGEHIGENCGSVELVEQIEEPFEWIIKFRYETEEKQAKPIWWRVSKSCFKEAPGVLGVAPSDIMLLYEDDKND